MGQEAGEEEREREGEGEGEREAPVVSRKARQRLLSAVTRGQMGSSLLSGAPAELSGRIPPHSAGIACSRFQTKKRGVASNSAGLGS